MDRVKQGTKKGAQQKKWSLFVSFLDIWASEPAQILGLQERGAPARLHHWSANPTQSSQRREKKTTPPPPQERRAHL